MDSWKGNSPWNVPTVPTTLQSTMARYFIDSSPSQTLLFFSFIARERYPFIVSRQTSPAQSCTLGPAKFRVEQFVILTIIAACNISGIKLHYHILCIEYLRVYLLARVSTPIWSCDSIFKSESSFQTKILLLYLFNLLSDRPCFRASSHTLRRAQSNVTFYEYW